MKFVIAENKIKNLIINFLKDNYTPDYDWGSDLFDFYKKEIERWGYVTFFINDYESFIYFDETEKNATTKGEIKYKTLIIHSHLSSKLNNFFGSGIWVDPFVEWFEENTNLEVDSVIRSLDTD